MGAKAYKFGCWVQAYKNAKKKRKTRKQRRLNLPEIQR